MWVGGGGEKGVQSEASSGVRLSVASTQKSDTRYCQSLVNMVVEIVDTYFT
jgi:hypothetical protein